ncbi:LytR C-terminal domain-containing protein [Frankia sp. AgPm24]|uniref:LytR C-terminal domain-containing protein n=1 Tax=Frankia sp. AgPm24 TaxID=631128 RepID=UPI00200DD656|nr:LytR C-terminal domain-containing protein [Frankia sp. AgPm24]MCK9920773.1 LytR C-terminal domain-containing protein [Frankia sp. AgPm24]
MAHGTGAPGQRRAPAGRGSRLRGVWAGIIAILAVLVGILVVNLVNGEDATKDPNASAAAPSRTPLDTALGTTSPSTIRSATASPTATPSAPARPDPVRTTPAPTPPPEQPAAGPGARPGAAVSTPIAVLNKSQIKGLAEAAARKLTDTGFTVSRTGNFLSTYNVPVTTVYYADGQEQAAQTLKDAVPGIEKIVPRSETRIVVEDPLILVITRDFPADPEK